ncbi:MAG: sigma factor, partial [Syntrophomonadaceae bacterium]|nr:sigma factor [Syntrophomonadaceae bacterium]
MIKDKKQSEMLAALYESNFRKLFLYATAHFNDDALAEEAVQEVFVLAHRRIDEVTTCPNPEGWLMNAQKYIVLRKLREQRQYRKTFISIEFLTSTTDKPWSVAATELAAEWSGLINEEDFK